MEAEKLRITVAGSGTVFLDDGRSQSCIVVEVGGETLVFDLGNGAVRSMTELGLDPLGVDRIFFTHFHPDHTSDIVPLLFSMKYGLEESNMKPLHLCGPEPFFDFWDSVMQGWGLWMRGDHLETSELPLDCEEPLELPGCTLTWARAKHRPESISYRLQANGSERAFVYPGDTEYCESVVELARGAHTLLVECSATDESPIPGHMTPSGVARLANEAGVERVILTHIFPETRKRDLISEVGRGFDGEVLLAEDGMTLEV